MKTKTSYHSAYLLRIDDDELSRALHQRALDENITIRELLLCALRQYLELKPKTREDD